MKFPKKVLLFAVAAGSYFSLAAQVTEAPSGYKNSIRTNITSVLLNNYSLQYERQVGNRMAVSASFRYMPQSQLPFKNTLRKALGIDTEEKEGFLNAARVNNIAITPEIKYFLSNKQEGFYASAFYRYAKFSTGNLGVDYTEKKRAEKQKIELSGTISSHSLGLQLGWQKNIGKRLVADIWILGPQYGRAKGSISGFTSKTLNSDEQQLLRQNLEEYKIRYYEEEISVNEHGASIGLRGPWAGIRTGINVGFRF